MERKFQIRKGASNLKSSPEKLAENTNVSSEVPLMNSIFTFFRQKTTRKLEIFMIISWEILRYEQALNAEEANLTVVIVDFSLNETFDDGFYERKRLYFLSAK